MEGERKAGRRPRREFIGRRAQAAAAIGDYADAAEDYSRALDGGDEPSAAADHTGRGWCYIVLEAWPLALRDFEQTVRLDPDNSDGYNGRGYALVRCGRSREAVRDADKALQLGRVSLRTLYNAARIFAQAAACAGRPREQADRLRAPATRPGPSSGSNGVAPRSPAPRLLASQRRTRRGPEPGSRDCRVPGPCRSLRCRPALRAPGRRTPWKGCRDVSPAVDGASRFRGLAVAADAPCEAGPRPSLELLSDRILPSIGLAGLTNPDLSLDKANRALVQAQIIETPAAALPPYHDSGTSSLSYRQLLDVIRAASPAAGLGAPVATVGTLELDGQTVQVLNLSYGSSVTFRLAFGDGGAASPGEPGSAAILSSNLLGGLVDVNSQGGDSRFLLDFDRPGRDWFGGPSLSLLLNSAYGAESAEGDFSADHALRDRASFGDHGPTQTQPAAASEGTSPSLAAFLTDRPNGMQIAGGLAAQTAGEAGGNPTGEVAANALGDPADVLIAVEPGVPDANADLFNLQKADLAVVPIYVVRDAPAVPAAETRADGRPDLSLTAYVVGLDETQAASRRSPSVAAADWAFAQLASKDGGGEMGAWRLAAAGLSSDRPESTAEPPSTASADAGLRLREWLDALVPRVERVPPWFRRSAWRECWPTCAGKVGVPAAAFRLRSDDRPRQPTDLIPTRFPALSQILSRRETFPQRLSVPPVPRRFSFGMRRSDSDAAKRGPARRPPTRPPGLPCRAAFLAAAWAALFRETSTRVLFAFAPIYIHSTSVGPPGPASRRP